MCPKPIRDVAESDCLAYKLIQGQHKGNQKYISAGVLGPVCPQLEEAGRPCWGSFIR